MSKKDFVHLHLHSDFSLLDGAIQIKPLAKRLGELGMHSCALTDHGNLFGALSFYHTMKAQGVKPLVGCEVYITRGSRFDKDKKALKPGEKANFHLILLAKNFEGYRNLVRLSSKAYTEGFYYKPRIDLELLAQNSAGLVGLSACMSGVPSALLARGAFEEAACAAHEFEEVLGKGNYFLEIQEHDLEAQKKIRKPLVDLAKRTSIPLVATNDAHYLRTEDARAHEILLCIGSGKNINDPGRLRYGPPNFYVRSAEEMWNIFGEELPETLTRTLEIAEMCDLELPKGANFLPVFPIPESERGQTLEGYFEKVVRDGFEQKRAAVWEPLQSKGALKHTLAEYQERISREVAVIKQMGFPSYFLIVWDFIKYARDNQIPVGPGRGSAAGSLVAYCLGITDVDPLQYDLLFERFLNPERVSMPDIDIDFCVRGRDQVIQHVTNLYGRQSVCQIITFGTMASKAAIKDVGRALNMPYAEVERIAKMIPPPVRGRNVSITSALEQVPELRKAIEENDQIKDLIDLARRLEGCARHTSVHAAGVVISPEPLEELVPVAVNASNQEVTTQFSMSDLEKTGMLKMDFLALTTLTIISDCLKSIKKTLNIEIDWSAIHLGDPGALELFAEGRTEAVFQFESVGMQEICRRLKPKGLEDLAALNALYRPGPLDGGMVDDFIERHHGHKAVRYIVPEMKEILSNTYGIIVYQEQIMQLAQKLAGYSLGEADLMRRAMGKKKREEMEKHEAKFIDGAVARGIKKEKAQQIFSLMAQFADYGFNRSHSVAYAYLAFQTAYLKAHFPEHFYAAVLSNELDDTGKVFKYVQELKGQKIRLLPPDINESDAGFTPVKGGIRYGLEALKGVGHSSVEAILEARKECRFSSFYDFAERVGHKGLNKRVLESLICAGAFDSFCREGVPLSAWRARLFAAVDSALTRGTRAQRSKEVGQNALFGASDNDPQEHLLDVLPEVAHWSKTELLSGEKNAIGFYITGHPLENYTEILSKLKCTQTSALLEAGAGRLVQTGGILTEVQVRTTKKGDRFALFRLEDQDGGVKCVVWPDVFNKWGKLLSDDRALVVTGKLEISDDNVCTIIVSEIMMLDEAVQKRARTMVVRLPEEFNAGAKLEGIWQVLQSHRGDCEVQFEMLLNGVLVRTRSHSALRVEGGLQLETKLKESGCLIDWMR